MDDSERPGWGAGDRRVGRPMDGWMGEAWPAGGWVVGR